MPLKCGTKASSLNVTVKRWWETLWSTAIRRFKLSIYLGKQSTISAANPLRFRAHSPRSLWSLECIRTADSRHTARSRSHAQTDLHTVHEHHFSHTIKMPDKGFYPWRHLPVTADHCYCIAFVDRNQKMVCAVLWPLWNTQRDEGEKWINLIKSLHATGALP